MSVKFGAIFSRPDERDYIYGKVVGLDRKTVYGALPARFMPDRIRINEQVIGDCVAQSVRSIKVHQEAKNHKGLGLDFAPDFLYTLCKKVDGIDEEGTEPRVAMKILADMGICRKHLYTDLKEHAVRPEPTSEAYKDAISYKVSAYAKIQTIAEIKHALVNQGPVMGASIITSNFVDCEDGGFIDVPFGAWLGGHAYVFDGYDDNMTHKYASGITRKGFFRIINSWGEDWGDKGYAYIPYDYITYTLKDLPGYRFFQEAWSSVDMITPPSFEKIVKMKLNSNIAYVDGKQVTLPVAPKSINGHTLAPLRFISEVNGFQVLWDAKTSEITLLK